MCASNIPFSSSRAYVFYQGALPMLDSTIDVKEAVVEM